MSVWACLEGTPYSVFDFGRFLEGLPLGLREICKVLSISTRHLLKSLYFCSRYLDSIYFKVLMTTCVALSYKTSIFQQTGPLSWFRCYDLSPLTLGVVSYFLGIGYGFSNKVNFMYLW